MEERGTSSLCSVGTLRRTLLSVYIFSREMCKDYFLNGASTGSLGSRVKSFSDVIKTYSEKRSIVKICDDESHNVFLDRSEIFHLKQP